MDAPFVLSKINTGDMNEKNILNAIFSDTSGEYVDPVEPEVGSNITIKIRVLADTASWVYLVTGDKETKMELTQKNVKGFDYYSTNISLSSDILLYYFMLEINGEKYFYDARGINRKIESPYCFKVIPGFHTPSWAKGGIFYQIYVDRFNNGDKSNDVVTNEYKYIDNLVVHKEWNQKIESGLNEHYGGDLQGIIDKLDYLAQLGIDVIYLNPIFVSPSNHKYDTADYDYVDPHFGVIINDDGCVLEDINQKNCDATKYINRITNKENLEASNALFADLVKKAHEKNIKVILDGVFNHCGSYNKWMDREGIYLKAKEYDKGAFFAKESKYHDYFKFNDSNGWPENKSYDAWWGFDTLPKLNYENEELYNYILEIGAKWVSKPYNADGWRLDVAADLGYNIKMNHAFWTDFRKKVKSANPNAIILAEHYGNPEEWLDGSQWDTVMNYDAFMEPVTWFLTGMEKHSDAYSEELISNRDAFWKAMKENGAKYSNSSLLVAMNELSNHDHSRFLTRTNKRVARYNSDGAGDGKEGSEISVLMQAVAIQMTWPGAPTIYYGDEAGVAGYTDPDNRRVYPWGNEDKKLIEYHREIIKIHKRYESLKFGALMELPTPYGCIAYGRKKGEEIVITVVNSLNVTLELKLSVWMLGVGTNRKYYRVMLTDKNEYSINKKTYRDKSGVLTLEIPPKGAIILSNVKGKTD